MSVAARWLIGGVRLYQASIRPLTSGSCRFHPSCSEYGVEALTHHGAVRGTALTVRRILRCNPWVPGGYDPVPAPRPVKTTRTVKTTR